MIHSANVNRDFEINVQVPEDCRSKKCPVIYSVDSDLFFGSLMGLSYYLTAAGGPSPILVGIGYKGGLLSSPWSDLRLVDLLNNSPEENASMKAYLKDAVASEQPNFGTGAPKFLQFVRDELIKYVEAHYNVDANDRTYMGYSGGSAFGLYVLATNPETFKRYVLGSSFKKSYLERFDKRLSDSRKLNLNIRLYFGVGLDEPLEGVPFYADFVSGFQDLAGILNRAKAPGVTYRYQAFPDQVHGTAWSPIFANGLRWVFLGDCKPYLYPDRKCPTDANP